MSPIRVAINGFGRIGRTIFRTMLNEPEVEVVAINDRGDAKTLAHLLKYDSVRGVLPLAVESGEGQLRVAGRACTALSNQRPKELPWKAMGVDRKSVV